MERYCVLSKIQKFADSIKIALFLLACATVSVNAAEGKQLAVFPGVHNGTYAYHVASSGTVDGVPFLDLTQAGNSAGNSYRALLADGSTATDLELMIRLMRHSQGQSADLRKELSLSPFVARKLFQDLNAQWARIQGGVRQLVGDRQDASSEEQLVPTREINEYGIVITAEQKEQLGRYVQAKIDQLQAEEARLEEEVRLAQVKEELRAQKEQAAHEERLTKAGQQWQKEYDRNFEAERGKQRFMREARCATSTFVFNIAQIRNGKLDVRRLSVAQIGNLMSELFQDKGKLTQDLNVTLQELLDDPNTRAQAEQLERQLLAALPGLQLNVPAVPSREAERYLQRLRQNDALVQAAVAASLQGLQTSSLTLGEIQYSFNGPAHQAGVGAQLGVLAGLSANRSLATLVADNKAAIQAVANLDGLLHVEAGEVPGAIVRFARKKLTEVTTADLARMFVGTTQGAQVQPLLDQVGVGVTVANVLAQHPVTQVRKYFSGWLTGLRWGNWLKTATLQEILDEANKKGWTDLQSAINSKFTPDQMSQTLVQVEAASPVHQLAKILDGQDVTVFSVEHLQQLFNGSPFNDVTKQFADLDRTKTLEQNAVRNEEVRAALVHVGDVLQQRDARVCVVKGLNNYFDHLTPRQLSALYEGTEYAQVVEEALKGFEQGDTTQTIGALLQDPVTQGHAKRLKDLLITNGPVRRVLDEHVNGVAHQVVASVQTNPNNAPARVVSDTAMVAALALLVRSTIAQRELSPVIESALVWGAGAYGAAKLPGMVRYIFNKNHQDNMRLLAQSLNGIAPEKRSHFGTYMRCFPFLQRERTYPWLTGSLRYLLGGGVLGFGLYSNGAHTVAQEAVASVVARVGGNTAREFASNAAMMAYHAFPARDVMMDTARNTATSLFSHLWSNPPYGWSAAGVLGLWGTYKSFGKGFWQVQSHKEHYKGLDAKAAAEKDAQVKLADKDRLLEQRAAEQQRVVADSQKKDRLLGQQDAEMTRLERQRVEEAEELQQLYQGRLAEGHKVLQRTQATLLRTQGELAALHTEISGSRGLQAQLAQKQAEVDRLTADLAQANEAYQAIVGSYAASAETAAALAQSITDNQGLGVAGAVAAQADARPAVAYEDQLQRLQEATALYSSNHSGQLMPISDIYDVVAGMLGEGLLRDALNKDQIVAELEAEIKSDKYKGRMKLQDMLPFLRVKMVRQ